MTALAAYQLGYKVRILTADEDSPAAQVAATTIAEADELAATEKFAAAVDVITFEFEKVAKPTLTALQKAAAPLRPSAECLELAQNRILEKRFIEKCGAKTTEWKPIYAAADLKGLELPFILKHALFGYDGKGQEKITSLPQAERAIKNGRGPWVAERVVEFDKELSCIVARGTDGTVAAYDICDNLHLDHVLKTTTVSAAIPPSIGERATAIATKLATEMKLVGLLAVEFFMLGNELPGNELRSNELLVNEFAPRPHNSGHWTNDAAACSQFEQLVRAVCGLPLASPRRLADVEMTNLFGDEATDPLPYLGDPLTKFWAYGKQPRVGRKVGHINRLRPFPVRK